MSTTLVSVLRVLSLLGAVALAIKLYRSGLRRQYPVLFYFLLFRVPEGFWVFSLDVQSKLYFYAWTVTQPIFWVFYVLLVVELSKLVLRSYRGLYTIFRMAMLASIAVSVIVALLTLLPKFTGLATIPQKSKTGILPLIFSAGRGIESSLAIFIFLILLFISRYPVVLSRNVRAHAVIYSVYFLSDTMGLLLRSMFGLDFAWAGSILYAVAETGAVAAWLVLLDPAGEKVPESGLRLTTAHEQRLLKQLDSMNGALLRSRH